MKTLADIPLELTAQAQQVALMRLHLYLIGRTHEMLRGVAEAARDALAENADEDGQIDTLGLWRVQQALDTAWGEMFGAWQRLFEGLRWEAAAIPVGTLAVMHEAFLGRTTIDEGRRLEEAPTPVFEPQLKEILDGAKARIWGDGLNLSQRIWRLDQESREGIRRTLYEGIASKDSAWNIAKKLEKYLGEGRDCPRWTRTRLYGRTKADIAGGDSTGLITGDACAGQGVAYNALRLARNEIQVAHHAATDLILSRLPWVQKERVQLSPAHPETDICDSVAGGGENGDGVYPVGEVILPLHPHCICYKTAVLMDPDAFAGRLRGWMRGEKEWPQMDQYGSWLGVGRQDLQSVSLAVGVAQRLVTWLWGDQAALDDIVERYLLPGGQLALPNV